MAKLTKAQTAALLLVAEGKVSYRPGHTNGPSSSWTRYSYEALVGGKFARRTKSVDFLVENGLATLAGSANNPCPVVLSETGRIATGRAFTPVSAGRVKIGRRVLSAHGAGARVTGDPASVDGKVHIPLAIGDLRFTGVFGPYDAVPVLS